MTQPIPSSDHGDSKLWRQEFERVRATEFNNYKKDDYSLTKDEIFPNEQFIEMTHVKYLESAGARVVPVDYTDNSVVM